MNATELNEVVELFKSKVGDRTELLMNHPLIEHKGIRYAGISIFDGAGPESIKTASISIKGTAEISIVTLHVDMNEFEITDAKTCKEMINRFVTTQIKIEL